MSFFHRVEHPPIGLEISASRLRLLQVLPGEDGPAIVAATRASSAPDLMQNPDPAAWLPAAAKLARSMMADAPFVGRRVVACIPDAWVEIRTLRLPPGEPGSSPSEPLVRREAAPQFPFDLATAHLQCIDAGQTRTGSELRREVIAIASPSDRLATLAVALDRAGLKGVSFDISPLAVYRGDARNAADANAARAVVHMDEQQTRVVIGQGHQVRFIKSIPIGAARLAESVSRRLGITPEEAVQLRRRLLAPDTSDATEREPVRKAVRQACRAILETLAGEVVPCLRYYRVSFLCPQPDRLRLVGPDAADPQTLSTLATATGLPAEAANPLNGFDLSHLSATDRERPASDWSTVLGLAVRRLPPNVARLKAA